MEHNDQNINVVFQYLAHGEEGSLEFETFMAFLRGLKDYSSLTEHYGEAFIRLLWLDVLPRINETHNKVSVIETLVEATYGNAESKMLEQLFNDYMSMLEQYATTLDNAARCLFGFIESGIEIREISGRILAFSDYQYAVALLAYINTCEWENFQFETDEIQDEVKNARRIRERTYIFAQFLVILHPGVGKYPKVSSIDFVFDYDGAHNDWPFSQEGSTLRLVEKGIIDSKEGIFFEKLGRFIHDENIDLKSPKVLDLYQNLFEGRDPLDVIFTLPSRK